MRELMNNHLEAEVIMLSKQVQKSNRLHYCRELGGYRMDLKAEVIDGLNSPLNELLGSLPENEFSKIEFIDVKRIMV